MNPTKMIPKESLVDPLSIPWELIEYNFRFDWIYTVEYGWLEFCWLPRDW